MFVFTHLHHHTSFVTQGSKCASVSSSPQHIASGVTTPTHKILASSSNMVSGVGENGASPIKTVSSAPLLASAPTPAPQKIDVIATTRLKGIL